MINYYRVLNVAPHASSNEIRKAFRQEAKLSHPDLYHRASPEEKQKLQKKFILLTQAYETLSDPEQRRAYDLKLQRANPQKPHFKARPSGTSFTQARPTSSSKPPPYTESTDETLEDLLSEVEAMLGKFGLQFKDPLEILVEWAMKVFQEFVDAWKDEDAEPEPEGHRPHTEKRRTMVEEIEEELKKLKRQNTASSAKSSKKATKPQKPSSPEIDQELRKLKKKYGKSR